MTIVGVGVDLVDARRFNNILERFGAKVYERLLHPNELNSMSQRRNNLRQNTLYLAKCWAVKEAVVKAMGTGFAKGVSWREIELLRTSLGRPAVKLHAQSLVVSSHLNIVRFHVSLSDESHWVQAFVIAEG